jgi:hypothetical protein
MAACLAYVLKVCLEVFNIRQAYAVSSQVLLSLFEVFQLFFGDPALYELPCPLFARATI